MSEVKGTEPKGTDWTSILSDPDLVKNLGKLLRAYREAPPESREQALLQAMREIKSAAPASGKNSEKASDKGAEKKGIDKGSQKSPFEPAGCLKEATRETQPVPVPTLESPPFELDIFTPNSSDDRRRHPRVRCYVAVEMRVNDAPTPIWGNLSNTSAGGCLVETSEAVSSGAKVEIGLWVANGKIWVKGFALSGIVTRTATAGVRIRFEGMDRSEKENLRQFLRYIQEEARAKRSENSYLAMLK